MIYKNEKNFARGYNEIINAQKHKEMCGMDFGIAVLDEGDVLHFKYEQEAVYDLLAGEITFQWGDNNVRARRENCFHEGAQLLHVPQNTEVTVTGISGYTEVAIMRTANEKNFAPRFMGPKDCLCGNEQRGAGLINGAAERIVRTFFDRSSCEDTNFFVGEVVHFPGKWSSFPPHVHDEPEMYYYKMLPENGFGFSQYADTAMLLKHNDCLGFPGNTMHSQVVAPGYSMFYIWCIPLRPEKNINTVEVKDYAWTAETNAKYFPEI